MEVSSLTPEESAVLFAVGILDELINDGLLTGDLMLCPKGICLWDQLYASGFKITEADFRIALEALGLDPGTIEGVVRLWEHHEIERIVSASEEESE
jgi:hypothetical protein